ncbi:MAG: hypothetical protein IMZ46_01540, partial [Acidobacteria bacterium]|nr:hypothetical protein [Acidobacteriota bacterium]
MKKSATDIWEDLKGQVDFLTEAGAGFVLKPAKGRSAGDPSRSVPPAPRQTASRPAAAASSRVQARDIKPLPPAAPPLPSLAGLPAQTAAERRSLEEIDKQVLVCRLCPLHKLRTQA